MDTTYFNLPGFKYVEMRAGKKKVIKSLNSKCLYREAFPIHWEQMDSEEQIVPNFQGEEDYIANAMPETYLNLRAQFRAAENHWSHCN